jgi:hypothetical protein
MIESRYESSEDARRRYVLGTDTDDGLWRRPVGANEVALAVLRVGSGGEVRTTAVVMHPVQVWREALSTGEAPAGVDAMAWRECRAAIARHVDALTAQREEQKP